MSIWFSDTVWVLLIASLVGVSCSMIGVFLVLRKLSMLGDAISHSVLFGIVLAFLLTSSRSPFVMVIGAGSVGLLTAYITSVLNRYGKVQEDASIGVTFTWLFALGVILIAAYADKIDLDQDCVLYGEIAFAPFDTVSLLGYEIGPRSFWTLLGVTVFNVVVLSAGYRPLKILSFDPMLASSLGINVTLWHYIFMTMISFTTVASFESVGAILVVAMLVVPANAAYLLARSLKMMMILSMSFAVLSALLGYYLASLYDASISAAMAMVSGLILLIVVVGTTVPRYVSREVSVKTP